MKNNSGVLISVVFGVFFLGGCGSPAALPSSTPGVAPQVAAIQTDAVATAHVQMTKTAAPTQSPTPTPNAAQTRRAKITPPAIFLTTLEPGKQPDMLQNALSVKPMEPFNGHSIRRITGWQYGFTNFEWMDENHLLIRPVVGWQGNNHGGYEFVGKPVVMQLNDQTLWFPPSHTAMYSSVLERLISVETTASGSVISTYNLKGQLLKTYEGKLLDISSSYSKILLTDGDSDASTAKVRWIDLKSNKEVTFNWEDFYSYACCDFFTWSFDEMKVSFTPYGRKYYGNAKTGESYDIDSYKVEHNEENAEQLINPPQHSYGVWVLNDNYLLTRWNEHDEGIPNFLSVFDPAKKAYRNLSALAGLPYTDEISAISPDPPFPCEDGLPTATSGGRYVWVDCLDGGRLIDMKTFKAQSYPQYPAASLKWSADGNFALLKTYEYGNKDGHWEQILSAASKKLTSMPADAECTAWHPRQNSVAYISNNGGTLSILNAENGAVQKQVDLPVAMNCSLRWNTFANKIALNAKDGSVWQIDSPALANLHQLTPPISGAQYATWSPDSSSIAFMANEDIYIVNVK